MTRDPSDGQAAHDQAARPLGGRAVVVTGAGGWIGAGIARCLARAGAHLMLHHRTSTAATGALAEELIAAGTPSTTVQADITDPGGAEAIVAATLSAHGRIDGVVNNAGIQPLRELLDTDAEALREVVEANLLGTHLVTRAAARAMIAQGGGGAIVQIASIEATQPARSHGHYAASKAAVVHHARGAALELGDHGIRVNVVSPGVIDRPGIEEAWPDGVARYRAAAPLGRLGTPADVGEACVFLLGDTASWVTGQELRVDGGVSVHPTY